MENELIPYSYRLFPNNGVIQADLEGKLGPVLDEIGWIQANFDKAQKYNNKLAGHIRKEFVLHESHNHLEQTVAPYVQAYMEQFDYARDVSMMSRCRNFKLDTAWVNFQEKGESNPPHNHTGVISFIIWIKIPYDFAEECKLFPDIAPEKVVSGKVSFIYSDILGKHLQFAFNVDKSFENKVLLFPSQMVHSVAPFYTSDGYRISISGNFWFDTLLPNPTGI